MQSDCKFRSFNASTSREIEAAFAALVRDRADALHVAGDVFFTSRRVQFATLAARHGIPAAYNSREYVETGGLMSYGTDVVGMCRQVGVYTGQILKGAKHSASFTPQYPGATGPHSVLLNGAHRGKGGGLGN